VDHYVTLERAIPCPRASVAVAADTASRVLTAAGYRRGLGFGPTQSYVRTYRPTWAVALGILLIPAFGLGLLLFLVRSRDHCNVVIEDGPYGVVALVSGRVPASLPGELEAASGAYPAPAGHGDQSQQPPPMLLTPSGGPFDGAPQQSSILRPATPVPGVFPGSPQHPGAPQQPQQAGAYGGGPYGGPYGAEPYGGWPGPSQQGGYAGAGDDPYQQPAARQPSYQQPQNQPQNQPAPVAHRPPSRLAPPPPADEPAPAAAGSAPGPVAAGPAPAGSPAGESPTHRTSSGRVPWAVAGGGRPVMPAPAGPPPISPPAWSPSGAPNPAPSAAPAPAPVAAGGNAPVGGRGEAARTVQQARPAAVATAAQGAGLALRADSGELLDIGPFCLLGREPAPRDGDPPAVLVPFQDAKLSVSKTHLAYGVDEYGLWVVDRNSTNGTSIIDPFGRRVPCPPEAREYVAVGAQVQIGQRRLTVEAAGA